MPHLPQGSRVSLYSLIDDDDSYLAACAAELVLPTWLSFVSRVPGTLHVSSKQLLFDPADPLRPVQCLPVRNLSNLCDPGEREAAGGGSGDTATLRFHCAGYKEIAGASGIGPRRPPEKAQEQWVFRLAAQHSGEFLARLRMATARGGSVDALLKRSETWLLQHGPRHDNERLATTATADADATASFPVWRVLPLRQQRGVLHISAAGLTFDPLCPLDGPDSRHGQGRALHVPAARVAHVLPRSIAFEGTGFDVYARAGAAIELAVALRFASAQERRHAIAYLQRSTPMPLFSPRLADAIAAWQQRRLTNFEYLALLNKLASRSTADLSQYPVFPWVIADCRSPALDLGDGAAYRDLRLPVGALNAARLAELQMRQRTLESVDEGASLRGGGGHLYSTHYSSAGAVSYFLVRSHPEYQLCLQHGRFDHPQRIFESVATTWDGVLNGHSDFKELIPEFFAGGGETADMLRPAAFALGVKDDGRAVSPAVVLPPWAGGSVARYAQLQAAALESDFVSAHLHHWINLIFGFQQTGEAAAAAHNTFHPFSYPPRSAEEAAAAVGEAPGGNVRVQHAREFGCTPTQLLTGPHPPRDGPGADDVYALLSVAGRAVCGDRPEDVEAVLAHGHGGEGGIDKGSSHHPPAPPQQQQHSHSTPQVGSDAAPLTAARVVGLCRWSEVAAFTAMAGAAAVDVAGTDPAPQRMVLSNLPGDDGGETLVTMVCDARRRTVGIFDCLTGERHRTFADFAGHVAVAVAVGQHVVLLTSEYDLFLVRLRTRAVIDHVEGVGFGAPAAGAYFGGCLCLADTEHRVRAWRLRDDDDDDGAGVADAVREDAPAIDFEVPSAVAVVGLGAGAPDAAGSVVVACADGGLWWRPGGETWEVCPTSPGGDDGAPVAVAPVAVRGEECALVTWAHAVQLYSLRSAALLCCAGAVPGSGGGAAFLASVALRDSSPLPALIMRSDGSGLLVIGNTGGGALQQQQQQLGTSDALLVEELAPPQTAGGHAGRRLLCCGSGGLVATLGASGAVAIHYVELVDEST